MKFALFYEIPVAEPWDADSELRAYKNTLEQALAGERFGWDAFWTVEHHFLQEYSHCSNPEILYGAIAAQTERMRLGLRRPAHAPAVQPPGAHGGVGGRPRPPLRRPGRLRAPGGRPPGSSSRDSASILRSPGPCGRRRIGHVVGCWTNDEYEFSGRYWKMPRRRVQPEAPAEAAPADLGGDDQRRRAPPDRRARPRPLLVRRRALPGEIKAQGRHLPGRRSRAAPNRWAPSSTTRRPRSRWPCARPIGRPAIDARPGVLRVVPGKVGARQIATLTDWMAERQQDLGTYSYAADMKKSDDRGARSTCSASST